MNVSVRRSGIWIVLAIWTVAASLMAADPLLGTWKLNETKSGLKIGPQTVTNTKDGDWIVAHVNGLDPQGNKFSITFRFKVDGNEYPVPTPFGPAKMSYKKIDDYTMLAVGKLESGDKITARTVISKDGKTRTITGMRENTTGEQFNDGDAVFERQ